MSKVNGDLYFQEASLLYAAHLGNQRKTKACKQLFFSFKICVFSSYHQNKILNWARGGQISDSEASEEKRGWKETLPHGKKLKAGFCRKYKKVTGWTGEVRYFTHILISPGSSSSFLTYLQLCHTLKSLAADDDSKLKYFICEILSWKLMADCHFIFFFSAEAKIVRWASPDIGCNFKTNVSCLRNKIISLFWLFNSSFSVRALNYLWLGFLQWQKAFSELKITLYSSLVLSSLDPQSAWWEHQCHWSSPTGPRGGSLPVCLSASFFIKSDFVSLSVSKFANELNK